MSSDDANYDVIVAGGGPAGSTAGALIAKDGRRVLLVDRETFPRFRIGESLMPATYWTFDRLGVLDRLKQSAFPLKQSVQFFSKTGRSSSPFYFTEFDPHESSITWQVDRREFDKMLLENAARLGCEVRQNVNVRDVLTDGGRVRGVIVDNEDGSREEITASVVVDATGQSALLSRKYGLKASDPMLRHAAVHTRYRGARRESGIDEGATLVLQTERPKCWFWYIPLPDDVVSVGIVGPIDVLVKGRGGDPQQIYDEEVALCPALRERIAGAEQVEDVGVLRDFSYISRRIAGEGWILAGDAFGFLDPIYSTGVFLALKSGEFAADAVLDALRCGDVSSASLGKYGERYVEGMEAMRKLVYAYYDEDFHVPRFLQEHPEYREHIVNLLVGNVFRRPIDGLFEAMGRMTSLPESRRLETSENVS